MNQFAQRYAAALTAAVVQPLSISSNARAESASDNESEFEMKPAGSNTAAVKHEDAAAAEFSVNQAPGFRGSRWAYGNRWQQPVRGWNWQRGWAGRGWNNWAYPYTNTAVVAVAPTPVVTVGGKQQALARCCMLLMLKTQHNIVTAACRYMSTSDSSSCSA